MLILFCFVYCPSAGAQACHSEIASRCDQWTACCPVSAVEHSHFCTSREMRPLILSLWAAASQRCKCGRWSAEPLTSAGTTAFFPPKRTCEIHTSSSTRCVIFCSEIMHFFHLISFFFAWSEIQIQFLSLYVQMRPYLVFWGRCSWILAASLSGKQTRNSVVQCDVEWAQKVEILHMRRSFSSTRMHLWWNLQDMQPWRSVTHCVFDSAASPPAPPVSVAHRND